MRTLTKDQPLPASADPFPSPPFLYLKIQLNQVRVAFPSARLLGGNTAVGLYKDATLDDLVEEDEEGGPSSTSGPRVVLCLERVKEMHGFTLDGTTLSKSKDDRVCICNISDTGSPSERLSMADLSGSNRLITPPPASFSASLLQPWVRPRR